MRIEGALSTFAFAAWLRSGRRDSGAEGRESLGLAARQSGLGGAAGESGLAGAAGAGEWPRAGEGPLGGPGPADEMAALGEPPIGDPEAAGEGGIAGPQAADEPGAPEDGKPKQPHQLSKEQQAEVAELRRRDSEVRAHEAAHAAAAGSFGGGTSYSYATGPDGRQYAVGGEVAVRLMGGRTPEEAIRNASQVRAAALAPADPSAQDRAVAAEASAIEAAARAELAAVRGAEVAARTRPTADQSVRRSGSESRVQSGQSGQSGTVDGQRPGESAGGAAAAVPLPEASFNPDETVRQLEQERRATRGQWRHLHLASGCGSCSASVAAYR